VACRSGSLREAEADARAALETLDPSTWGSTAPIYPLAFLIEALVERGELPAAEQVLGEADVGEELPELAQFNRLLFSRAGLRLAQGLIREGTDDLLECGRRLEAFGMRNPAAIPWRSLARSWISAPRSVATGRGWMPATHSARASTSPCVALPPPWPSALTKSSWLPARVPGG
jgi:hypothetical protein